MAKPSPPHPPTESSATGRRMTGHQSLQFMEYLREGRHLKPTDAREITDQPQGDVPRNPQAASQVRIWEATDLTASEFADQAARFYHYERVTLEDMLSATP